MPRKRRRVSQKKRSKGESIPGCQGLGGGKDWDYCYDPKYHYGFYCDGTTTKKQCAQIASCATTETCTSSSNSQCAKCNSGYYLSHGTKDTCAKCPTSYYCDGLTKKSCTPIVGCATATCSTSSNQQCAKCSSFYYLVNAPKNSCAACPAGKICDGTVTIVKYTNSCLDYYNAGQRTNGQYTIFVDGKKVRVWCDMKTSGGGWTIVGAVSGSNSEQPLVTNTATTSVKKYTFVSGSNPGTGGKLFSGYKEWTNLAVGSYFPLGGKEYAGITQFAVTVDLVDQNWGGCGRGSVRLTNGRDTLWRSYAAPRCSSKMMSGTVTAANLDKIKPGDKLMFQWECNCQNGHTLWIKKISGTFLMGPNPIAFEAYSLDRETKAVISKMSTESLFVRSGGQYF